MIRRHRRAILAGVGVLGLLVFAAAVLHAVDDGDGFGLIDGEGSRTWQYIGIFLLIAADAILPILPSESTLHPLASMVISGAITTLFVVTLFFVLRRQGPAPADGSLEAPAS